MYGTSWELRPSANIATPILQIIVLYNAKAGLAYSLSDGLVNYRYDSNVIGHVIVRGI